MQMWGGVECTINRVEDAYFSQLDRSGHLGRDDDLERFAALGLRALRYPVLWEQIAPDGDVEAADWAWPDRQLQTLRRLRIEPIVGLVHHGSGPRGTSLLDPAFAPRLAEYAGRVARRYPWVSSWTPVNEPLTTARFSALYGIWYPHAADDRSFVAALLNECRAIVLSMAAIRAVNREARLVQTDDLSKTWGTAPLAAKVAFYNERRWLAWDLLCGRVDAAHPLHGYLLEHGASIDELAWFEDHRCPPDVVGVNYYVTSERWLDHRLERYPGRAAHAVGGETAFVDVEAVRVMATPTVGLDALLEETWQRYRLPIAVTEAHLDARREDQLRWLVEVWQAAQRASDAGADIRAVTAWALLGSFDWNCLLGACRGYYEPGPFDVRAPAPRPTALAGLIGELAAGRAPSHPVLQGDGWWRRADRFIAKPVSVPHAVTPLALFRAAAPVSAMAPLLVSGANGTLGDAFGRVCAQRNLACRLVGREGMDIADPAAVEAMLEETRPWAVVNASGYVRIDAAEADEASCLRDNATGAAVLAAACARRGLPFITFSSDQVFDGERDVPWLERDVPAPRNAYGRSKAAAEQAVLQAYPRAMVVRTSAFFGPWDRWNFVARVLDEVELGHRISAAADVRISPTYVPDLVGTCLDLLIDGESGLWHLANRGNVSWYELAAKALALAGLDDSRLRPLRGALPGEVAPRPRYGVLDSERAALMPPLDDALARFMAERETARAVRRVEAAAALTTRPRR